MEECKYYFDCKNNDKCYRCSSFNLHSPIKRIKSFNKIKSRTNSNAVLRDENSWENLEQEVADSLNNVPTIEEARRSIRSGAFDIEKEDVVDWLLFIECKERKGNELKGKGQKSFSIKKEWLEIAKGQADKVNKPMTLPFRFKDDDKIYTIMDFEDLSELNGIIKSYYTRNIKLEKENEILKKKMT
ncbi:MAG: hypothetical protein B6I28_00405 [Fusobacteriia bacterium 4572_132]|nr:MAG: hypothetical protein B6I28_00405 [Fusobacteriia bacterium 4572_132]